MDAVFGQAAKLGVGIDPFMTASLSEFDFGFQQELTPKKQPVAPPMDSFPSMKKEKPAGDPFAQFDFSLPPQQIKPTTFQTQVEQHT